MSSIPRRRLQRLLGASCLAATVAFSTGASIAIAAPQTTAPASRIAQDDSGGSDQGGSDQGGSDQGGSDQGGSDQGATSNQGSTGQGATSNQGGIIPSTPDHSNLNQTSPDKSGGVQAGTQNQTTNGQSTSHGQGTQKTPKSNNCAQQQVGNTGYNFGCIYHPESPPQKKVTNNPAPTIQQPSWGPNYKHAKQIWCGATKVFGWRCT
ncbi:hypothetical protein GCM10017776_06720 [Streptomyces griseoluteus]|nr:hypothetical protein GCM10017776_06720 [Streptomyces griseoluteus]